MNKFEPTEGIWITARDFETRWPEADDGEFTAPVRSDHKQIGVLKAVAQRTGRQAVVSIQWTAGTSHVDQQIEIVRFHDKSGNRRFYLRCPGCGRCRMKLVFVPSTLVKRAAGTGTYAFICAACLASNGPSQSAGSTFSLKKKRVRQADGTASGKEASACSCHSPTETNDGGLSIIRSSGSCR